jgi:hypothetical protein
MRKRFVCLRCGYDWLPNARTLKKGTPPKNCANPKCNSPYWNRMRVKRKERDAV